MADRGHWRFAGFVFDNAAHTLSLDGSPIELERRPMELLTLLLAHAGELVIKEEILDKLWPDREVSEASLTTCVGKLRQGLRDTGHAMLRTVHGYGYRFAVPVTRVSAGPDGTAAPTLPALAAGHAVPGRSNYRLVRRLGAGGFGEAWLAEQAKSQDVRVFKFARDEFGLAALRREIALGRLLREALGPRYDLVRILDWQLERPPSFIEIAYFEQGNLAEWLAGQGGAAAVPLATRIELAAQIADALAAIHGLSILHKDLKPANILIREQHGRPAIALTDFGSGRALNTALFEQLGITRMGADLTADTPTAGTQTYAAPELADRDMPTVLTDIYALGVILYQLVSGDMNRPFAPGWEARIEDPLLRQDIARAAAGDPRQRLTDAAELACLLRDLPARHTARLAAEAEKAEILRTRRALEISRARRMPLAALVMVLAAAIIAVTGLYLRAQSNAARAQAVTAFLTDDVLSAANPLLAANPDASLKAVLASAARDLQTRFPKDDLDRAGIEQAIGSAYAGLIDREHALPLLQAALAIFTARLSGTAQQSLSVRLTIGDLAERTMDYAGMQREGSLVLAAKPRDAATEIAARTLVLVAGCNLAGNNAACVTKLKPFWQEVRSRLGPADALTLRVQSELAFQLSQTESFADAIALSRETVALTAHALGPGHLLVQERQFHLGEILVGAGQTAEGARVLADVRARLLDAGAGASELSARCAVQLGMAYFQLKRYDEALAAQQAALSTMLKLRGPADPVAIVALNDIANIDAAMGRMQEAVTDGQRVYQLQRDSLGADQADTIWFENNLANFQHLAQNLPASEATYRDVVSRARRTFSHGEWDLGYFLFRLGQVIAEQGRPQEARPLLVDGIGRMKARLGAGNGRVVKAEAVLTGLP